VSRRGPPGPSSAGPSSAGPSPVDRARGIIGARLEAEYPGWKLAHGLYGWTATRPADGRVVRSDSVPGLEVLLRIAGRVDRAG
jgi:hypothetical protein